MNRIIYILLLTLTTLISGVASAQTPSAAVRQDVADLLTRIVKREVLGGAVKIDRMKVAGDKLEIYASIGLSYYPFREDNVKAMYDSVRLALPDKYAKYRLAITARRQRIKCVL